MMLTFSVFESDKVAISPEKTEGAFWVAVRIGCDGNTADLALFCPSEFAAHRMAVALEDAFAARNDLSLGEVAE